MAGPEIKHDLEIKFGNEYGEEEERAVLEVLRKNAPTSGEACIEFEKAFAAYCGVKHARVVSNGTAALFLSMIALGLKPGDTVLTTPMTWIATAAAPATLGLTVDFVDVDPFTGCMDVHQLKKKLSLDVKAVIPVHLYGQACDMDILMALAREYKFAVVEDSCHALGAEFKSRKLGSFGSTGSSHTPVGGG